MTAQPLTKREQREASVENLLGAALSLFVRQGYKHTSVEAIADAVGLTKGSVFFYFGAKAKLLDHLLDRVEEIVVDAMEARVAAAGADPRAQIVAFIHGQSMLGVEGWEYVLLLILMSLEFRDAGDAIETRIAKIYDRLYAAIEAIIEDGKAAGVFRTDINSREQAAIVMAGHDGTFLQWHRRGRALDGEELVRALRTFTLAGLLPNAG
ncbi:MAG: TetR/AcrR family transcriptional regulator [Alphaproteobacteria bacterium]